MSAHRFGVEAADLYIVGSGMRSFVDLTFEAVSALETASIVYYLHDMPTLDRYLESLEAQAVNLLPKHYHDGRQLSDIYEAVATEVMAAVRVKTSVVMLLHGHPLVYNAISRRLMHACRELGHTFRLVPGISSLDRIFNALELDISHNGLQVYDVASCIVRNVRLNVMADALLFQVGHSLSPIAARTIPCSPRDIEPLRDYLLREYPPSHGVRIVEVGIELGVSDRITDTTIAHLCEEAGRFNYNASLFVPARDTS